VYYNVVLFIISRFRQQGLAKSKEFSLSFPEFLPIFKASFPESEC